jgi:hypothetical protein
MSAGEDCQRARRLSKFVKTIDARENYQRAKTINARRRATAFLAARHRVG